MAVRTAVLMGIVLLFGAAAFAQSPVGVVPGPGDAEVGADYAYVRAHANHSLVQPFSLNGGGASFVYFFHDWIGIKADLQGYGSTTQHYATSRGNFAVRGNLFTYLGGVEIKGRWTGFQPFGELLFGGAYTNATGNLANAEGLTGAGADNNGFAAAVGGGLDYHFADSNVALRLGEADYLLTRLGNTVVGTKNQSSFRFQAGIVFKF